MLRLPRVPAIGWLPFWLSGSPLAEPAPPPATEAPATPPATETPPAPVAPEAPAPPAEPKEDQQQTPEEPVTPDTPPVPPTQPVVPSDLPEAPPQPAGPEPVVPRQPPPLANRPLPAAPAATEIDRAEPERPPLERSLGLEALFGFGVRIGGSDVDYSESERVDLTFGLGAWFAPSRVWAFGVAYQRQGLGSDRTPSAEESFTADRDLDTLWLSGRLFFFERDRTRLFAELGGGLTWQQVHANGTHAGDFVNAPTVFVCGEAAGPVPALGGGAGLDVDVEPNIGFVSVVSLSAHPTTDDVIDGCVPGAGLVIEPALRLGFVYRFGL